MALSKNQIAALDFVEKCKEFGFKFSIRASTITISKTIPANSNHDFAKAESESSTLLCMVPTTTLGSIWGTDGASVGGHVAMQTGAFVMNKSGCSKRVLNAILKIC